MKYTALMITFSAAMALAATVACAAPSAAASQALTQAVNRGAVLFAAGHFGSTLHAPLSASAAFNSFGDTDQQGPVMTCETCHSNGGRTRGHIPGGSSIASLINASTIFPRYREHHGVVTMAMQIRHCVRAGIHGRAPAYGSQDIVDLEAYLGSLAQGQRMLIGGAPR